MTLLPDAPSPAHPRRLGIAPPGLRSVITVPATRLRRVDKRSAVHQRPREIRWTAPALVHPTAGTTIKAGLLWAAFAAGAPAADAVQAQLSARELAFGQPVELTLTAQGAAPAGPDLSVLEQDFRILDQRVERRLAINNGHRSAQLRLTLLLLPLRDGALQVPAITMGDLHTAPLTLTVRPDTGQPTEPRAFAPPPFAPPLPSALPGPPPTPRIDPWNTPWTDRTPPSAPTAAPGGSNTWFWVSLGLASVLAAVLFTRRGAPIARPPAAAPSPPAPIAPVDQAREQIHAAYQAGDAAAARSALLQWAALRWPEAPPGNLAQLAQRCPPPLRTAINRLEMAFFSPAPIAWAQEPVAAGLDALERL